ncbi:hypothetical protein [Cellulomonas oligotrophica]|uniref:Uncharacterized protein n=1 Tax=Cellulomonas oligotrophica TaxID=931536 RepID=A0A7Y9FDB8_9CELL|nr:hypothetical protein [Cellulomonas oligotrophica]NYD85286.1 hypothetical protein [Cellulomonas oligotrophica]GIG33278.1 hypothetical protein Col01nite_24370 [Cellulomonas oligotrophica]
MPDRTATPAPGPGAPAGQTPAGARGGGFAGQRRDVANSEVPDGIPTRPQGDVPVIVRVVWSDGVEEWRPARAVRWTRSHVMVAWRDRETDPRSERHTWLRAGDVARSVSWFVPPARPGP